MEAKGFTLIEIIVSLFVLCLLSVTLLMMSTFYVTTMARASNSYEAMNQAEEVMDRVVLELENTPCSETVLEALEASYTKDGLEVEIAPYLSTDALEVKVRNIGTNSIIRTLVWSP